MRLFKKALTEKFCEDWEMSFQVGHKIISLKNNYRHDILNGQMFTIVEKKGKQVRLEERRQNGLFGLLVVCSTNIRFLWRTPSPYTSFKAHRPRKCLY